MKAIFPGSFDPITNGHLDVIKRSAQLFEHVYVVILTNTAKKPLFSAEKRQMLVEDAIKDLSNVTVLLKEADLTVNVANQLGAQVIIRALRNAQDFEFEKNIAEMNKNLAPQIETMLLVTDPKYSFVSSSLVKEVARFKGDVSQLVSPLVLAELKKANKA
ncbi:pantetheine-phosphate adenylyltransferase [Ligilactobacillus apodemi]|uniref:Phosphopantetheine adenylyltransferase n=1 Tax=Ligilactobacillus apodemi DSM 16634 = JCM 16172 TaxID=1423724 RepID=A0A0R1TV81_9LACO|nr:pantetheine-phosphate adenylyltransferase [Ligilactobacillus apodemi]KRL84116.1 pantetheine-phosphate adenylyltransferase [Ligilactobacillus apodemi DSM 16634 = JCM 16172]